VLSTPNTRLTREGLVLKRQIERAKVKRGSSAAA
jgi:hypothetical protein